MQNLLKRAPVLIAIGLTCIVVAALYFQSVELWSKPVAAPVILPPVTSSSIPSQPQRNIATLRLFGDATKKSETAPPPEKNLPKTNLRLTLTGVSAGSGDKAASALIEGPDKSTLLYKVGDSVPGNATLNNIYDDRVVLKRSGRLENLYFPKVSTGGGQYLAQVESHDQQSSSVPRTQVKAPSVDPSRKTSIKERLSTLRNRIRNGQN
jgi:general secretion pathway protein C